MPGPEPDTGLDLTARDHDLRQSQEATLSYRAPLVCVAARVHGLSETQERKHRGVSSVAIFTREFLGARCCEGDPGAKNREAPALAERAPGIQMGHTVGVGAVSQQRGQESQAAIVL